MKHVYVVMAFGAPHSVAFTDYDARSCVEEMLAMESLFSDLGDSKATYQEVPLILEPDPNEQIEGFIVIDEIGEFTPEMARHLLSLPSKPSAIETPRRESESLYDILTKEDS